MAGKWIVDDVLGRYLGWMWCDDPVFDRKMRRWRKGGMMLPCSRGQGALRSAARLILGDRGEGCLAGPSAQSMTRARPTGRGRARCVLLRFGAARGQTAASPRAGACRLRCVGRRCLPLRGKGAAVWARLILVGLWEKLFAGGFALQKGRQARRGGAVSCGGVRSTKPPSFRRRPAGRTQDVDKVNRLTER